MQLTLNENLKETNRKSNNHQYIIDKLSNLKYDCAKKASVKSLFHVFNDLTGSYSHSNYFDYLLTAWDSHLGIVVSPDIIWYELLCELTGLVAKKTEEYRGLFTTSQEKQNIIVVSGSLIEMPLNILINALKEKVPTDAEVFLPKFTTTNERALSARYAAFADMCSPYYNYMMAACGFPAIDIQGEAEDWNKILQNWKIIGKLFKYDKSYCDRVENTLDEIVHSLDEKAFWKKMFVLEHCGSGHQYETSGWITELFAEKPKTAYPNNFASHISTVSYKQLNTQKNYEMKQGLFSSDLDSNNFLRPNFAKIIYEKTELVEEIVK